MTRTSEPPINDPVGFVLGGVVTMRCGADGPAAGGGHQFGRQNARAAGVPWGWVNREPSPERQAYIHAQKEFDLKDKEAREKFHALLRQYPLLRVTGKDYFASTVGKSSFIDVLRDEKFLSLVREQERRMAVYEKAQR